jgi:hypothetical protein
MAGLMAAGKSRRRAAGSPPFAVRWGELDVSSGGPGATQSGGFFECFAAVLFCATVTCPDSDYTIYF